MAEQLRKTNPLIRYGVIVVVLGLILYNYLQGQKPLVQSGTLEYRMVTGSTKGDFQVILLETSDRYVILDSAFREILVAEDGELISRPKQIRLLEKYQDIEYRVSIIDQASGSKPAYRVSRELFNQLRFGELTKYEVSKKQKDSILAILPQ